ncbi:hypothetical protein FJT64_017440 [Amphibalanus amphitrite]|uniref:Uncharacterized protein n=1 Tax=Amphibalanus amphitrite TaxID=1232801 RepID=A0A6A4X0P2_AMPAM|nr:hypothetical protein FJT64_017440 [Amphibalanus amphitrite]
MASTAPTAVATRPTAGLQQPARAEELANQRFRLRDVDADEEHMLEDGKQIDVFTEHVVELQVARRHVRVSDAASSVELDALRLRVRDVARRRARVTDHESVMNVLTEKVRVSDVVTRRVTAAQGARRWCAVGREVHTDGQERERVEFGDLPEQPEPVVTLPDEEDDEGFQGSDGDLDDVDGLTIEELCGDSETDQSGIAWVLCSSDECSEARALRRPWRKLPSRAPSPSEQPQEDAAVSPDREEELRSRLAGQPAPCCPGVCRCASSQQSTAGSRRWSKKSRRPSANIGGGVGILGIRQKHSRRPLQHRQARARGAGGKR